MNARKFVLAGLLAGIFAAPAVAQTPEVLQALEMDSDVTAEGAYLAISGSRGVVILKQAPSLVEFKACEPQVIKRLMDDGIRGNDATKTRLAAKSAAGCIVGARRFNAEVLSSGASTPTKIDYPPYIYLAGIALARANLSSPTGTDAELKRAAIYLDFAKSNGFADADKVLAEVRAALNPTKATDDAGDKIPSLTAEQAVSSSRANEIGFQQQYAGKIIKITGTLSKISGDMSRASLSLLGNTKKAKENLTQWDYVDCEITDPDEVAKAGSLAKGKTVTVRGAYKPSRMDPFPGQVRLTGCRVS